MTSGIPSAASVMPATMSEPKGDLSKGSRPCNAGRRRSGLLHSCLSALTVVGAYFYRYSVGKRLLRSRLVCLLGEFKCIVRINILATKIFNSADPKLAWRGAALL